MEWKKLIKLLYPPVWIPILLTPICTAALIIIFINGYEERPLAYAAYILSFYTLCVIVMGCIKVFPRYFSSAKKAVYANAVGERFMTDMPFRTYISLYGSLGINLLYVLLNVISGVLYGSAWFYVLAVYYTILAAMRFLLVRFTNRIGIGNDRLGELRRSRACGYILLTINFTLSGAVLMILFRDKGYEYHGILIYVMALYTFWITAVAIRNLVKYKRFGSPVMSMAKIISMAAALVSMLSLETAMLSEFGVDMTAEARRLFIMLTGAGVSAVVITMSAYSIIKNTKEIRAITEEQDHGE